MFSLYVPFQLPDGQDFTTLPCVSTLLGYALEITQVMPYVTLAVRGVPTREQAEVLLWELADALHWAALDRRIGIRFTRTLSEVVRPDDPVKAAKGFARDQLDGIVDGSRPFVKRETEMVLKMVGQEVSFRLSQPPEVFARALEVGVETVRAAGPIPPKLDLACEIYSQTHFLSSGFARFLALFMPLEIAAPDDVPAPTSVVAHVERWTDELRSDICRLSPSDPTRRALEVLHGRLGQLRKQSHNSRIQEFVASKFQLVVST
jgi:hypothetical protein